MNPSPGRSARILAFPAILTEPVQQQARPGRLPRAVASLRRVRAARAAEAEARQAAQAEAAALLARAEVYLYAVFKLRRWLEEDRA